MQMFQIFGDKLNGIVTADNQFKSNSDWNATG